LDEKTNPSADAAQANHSKVPLLVSPEGRILLIGVALALGFILWLGIKFLVSPEQSQVLTGTTATAAVFGRAAGLAFGYAMGLGHVMVISICMIVETAMVLIFYPLFVFSWQHLLVIKRLKSFFERIHRAAESHKDKVQKYGIIGLFAFVWFPFWMTGPIVGCVIGFLLGLRPWVNMVVVLAGTYVAILAWALFMHGVHDRVTAYGSDAAIVLLVLLIVVVVIARFLHRTLHENRNRA
jgi:uncharacterized membrane protein